MSKSNISVRDFLEDVKAGLNNDALRNKYGLDAEGLRKVFRELRTAGFLALVGRDYVVLPMRRLSARMIANDVRSGMNSSQLMEKYSLSSKQLIKTIDVLVRNKALSYDDISDDLAELSASTGPRDQREAERCYLDFELPIVDMGPPEIDGTVRDLTEKGIGLVGIPSSVGENKTFFVLPEEFAFIESFMFEAVCRWVARNEPGGEFVSGFQITKIADKDLAELRKLIQAVTFCA
jgi:uncharacterized protein (DUF433 family)